MSKMKNIWDKVSVPGPDGRRYITYAGDYDLEYLYSTGFVDTGRFSLEEWKAAFAGLKQPCGTYKINEDQWMALQPFHYEGPVDDPFDPEVIKEGTFSTEELIAFFQKYIIPSTLLKTEHIEMLFGEYEKEGRLVSDKMVVDDLFKKEIAELLEKYPSPMRRLQMDVKKIRDKNKFKAEEKTKDSQESTFKKGPSVQKSAASMLDQLTLGKKKK